jgi:hypothetical protein|nr:MAG TPA: hypothetical protein [Caudoviricetes sp.]
MENVEITINDDGTRTIHMYYAVIQKENQDWSYCEINFGISNKDIPDGALEKINNMYMNFFFEELKFYDARLCTKEEYLTSCDETKYNCQHWEVK